MTTAPPRDEPPRDEYLRAALRHAPDHALTPPSGVNQAILAAARQVHRPRPAVEATPAARAAAPARSVPRRSRPWHEQLQWLLSPRWAGGLASVLVGALVIGLWLDEEVPAPTAPREEDVASRASQREAATPAASMAPPPTAATDSATAASEPALGKVLADVRSSPASVTAEPASAPPPESRANADTPKAPPERDAGLAAQALRRDGPGERVTPPQPQQRAAQAPDTTSTPGARDAAQEAASTPPSPAPAPMAPPQLERQAAARASAGGGVNAGRPESRSPDAADTKSATGATAPTPESALRFRAEALERPAAVAAAASAASPALTTWRRATNESAARSAIWTWQPGADASPRSFDADGQSWLLRVVQTARGRWVDVAESSDGGAALEVRWWRDDQPHARLRIETQGLRWIEPSGRVRYAALGPAALERLRGF